MRYLALFFLCLAAIAQVPSPPIQDLNVLIGKKVIVQRTVLCPPATFKWTLDYAGKTATVISVKPGPQIALRPRRPEQLPPGTRALLEDQRRAATILVQFEDGTLLDSCMAISPAQLSEHFELAPGQILEAAPAPPSDPTPTMVPTPTPTPDIQTPTPASSVPSTTAAPSITAANAQTMIGKHRLGETVREWFAVEGVNSLETACQSGKSPEAQALWSLKLTPKGHAKLCQTLLNAQSSGNGKFGKDAPGIGGAQMVYDIIHGKVAVVERTVFPDLLLGGFGQEMKFLSDQYGQPSANSTSTWQNGFGATRTGLNTFWKLPNGDTIAAMEELVTFSLGTILKVTFITRERSAEIAAMPASTNPYK